jgi:hypothetical protein
MKQYNQGALKDEGNVRFSLQPAVVEVARSIRYGESDRSDSKHWAGGGKPSDSPDAVNEQSVTVDD